MTYVVHYGVLRTGADISTLPAQACSFGDELRGIGSFNASVPVGQCGNGALWQATRGAFTFWAVEWAGDFGRRIVAAGPMWARTGDDNGISYGGSNLFGLMAHRKLINQSWPDATLPTGTLTYSNLDLGSIMRAIVAQVTAVAPADLPIVLEAPRAGINTRTYLGADLAYAGDRITELGNVEDGTAGMGGPDWLFRPQFKGDRTTAVDFTKIEWQFLTGSAAKPWLTQAGAPVVLDRGARLQQRVGPVSVQEDAGRLTTTSYNVGGGVQAAKVIASATDTVLTDAGYPRLDGEASSNATAYSDVAKYAAAQLTRSKRTPAGTKVSVRASWWWQQGLDVGAQVRLIDPAHPVFGAIDLTSRVLQWSADVSSEWVSLTLADSLTAV